MRFARNAPSAACKLSGRYKAIGLNSNNKGNIMYWITTQWPQLTNQFNNPKNQSLYLKPENSKVVEGQMMIGDIVFIYQSKTGPEEIEDNRVFKRHQGVEGINQISIVSNIKKEKDCFNLHFKDCSQNWCEYAEMKTLNRNIFIPRKEICEILGYSDNYNLHGFGDSHSGIKKINKECAVRLVEQITIYRGPLR